jgi:hypothetical protein
VSTGNFASIDDVRQGGFVGGVAISALRKSVCREVPDKPGVYLILRLDATTPTFLPIGTGAYKNGTDPNVGVGRLRSKWVEGAIVVNIGRAGAPGRTATLNSRLLDYVRFGQGRNSGHSGGRYIWQLHGSGNLLVCWKPTGKAVPRDVEKRLIAEFEQRYGKIPFANLNR